MTSVRNQSAPVGPLVTLEKPVYGGACLARVEGKAVFVPLTLPGEQARIRIAQSRMAFAEGEAAEIVQPSPQRVAAACPHFGVCGGCAYQHAAYPAQLAMKQAILRETLERAGVHPPAEIGMLSGEPWGYRNRIRLAFDAQGNPGYRGRRSHAVTPIAECPIAAPHLAEAALAFARIARVAAPALKPTELALFANAEGSQLLLTVIAASARKHRFEALAEALSREIPALIGAELAVEDRGSAFPRTVARSGAASLTYRAAGFDYRVDHGAFFQVNRGLVDGLVEKVVQGQTGKLAWDLFAGVGLFARQLTSRFDRVVAVESAPSSTQALAANLKGTRGIPVRSATLEFLRANLPQAKPDRAVPDLIVVDPPRIGLGAESCELLLRIGAPTLVSVSCDPATLARDLKWLTAGGYTLQSVTLADLFPQTFHLESIAILKKS
jgi:23S rRNA (uracil1939-C5)-methyltransferase